MEIRSKRQQTTASGRPIAPSAERPQGLATASLVLGACTLFLCPSFTPLTVVLGPFAWLLGWLDAKDAARRKQRQSLTGRLGVAIGRITTGILAVIAGLLLIVVIVTWGL